MRHLITVLTFFSIAIGFNLVCKSSLANENINLTSINFSANEKLVEQQVAEILIKNIYSKIGINANVEPVPPLRANSKNLNMESDGEIARIFPYGEKNPSLIRVDPPYYYLTTTGFCLKGKKIKLKTKEDLKGHSIAVIRGVAHTDSATEGLPNVMAISTGIQMYDLVLNGRVEIALDSGINGRKILRQKIYSSLEECGTIAKLDLYNYLNSKSASRKDAVSNMIKKLKENGELDKLVHKAEQEVLSKE